MTLRQSGRTVRCGDQRMIARYHGLFRQTLEQRLRRYRPSTIALLAVHELLRVLDTAAERLADGLMAEAHAEDAGCRPPSFVTTSSQMPASFGIAGTRREDDVRGVQILRFR